MPIKTKTKTLKSKVTGETTTFRQCNSKLLKKIQALVADIKGDHAKLRQGRLPDYVENYHAQYARIEELDKEAKALDPILGRHVSWPKADGHAHYFVAEVNEYVCKMIHVPIGDSWHSDAVCNGFAFREAVEQAIKWVEGMKAIFKDKPVIKVTKNVLKKVKALKP